MRIGLRPVPRRDASRRACSVRPSTGTKQRRGVNPDGPAILPEQPDSNGQSPFSRRPHGQWPATAPKTYGELPANQKEFGHLEPLLRGWRGR